MRRLTFLLLALVLLAGCTAKPQTTETPTLVVVQPTETPLVLPTDTPLPDKVVLVSDPAVDPALTASIQEKLNTLTAASGKVLETRPSAAITDLAPDWGIVVFTTPPADLDQWLAAAPQTQFVLITPTERTPGPNLTVIRTRLDKLAFSAGYLSTMIAYDFRAAGLVPSDDPIGPMWVDAFTNGGRYWCGLCNPFFAPLVRFPLVTYQPRGSSVDSWLAAVDQLNLNLVYVLYVAPEVSTPELLFALASRGFILIGSVTPQNEIRSRWAATLRTDSAAALETAWQAVASGAGGQVLDAPLVLEDVNDQYISTGRVDQMERTLQDIHDGMIYFFTPPLE